MKNLVCWACAVAGFVGLLMWGNAEPITLQRGSRSAWAKLWKVAEVTPVPGAKPKKPVTVRRPPAPPASLTRAEAEQIIRGSACLQRADFIVPRLRRSIRVSAVPVDDASDLAKGASRMTAAPDVPSGFQWPQRQGKPLTMIAQLNLSELAPLDEDGALPSAGWLYFFYALAADPPITGEQPEDRDAWHVAYFDGPVEALQRLPWPKSLKSDAPPCRVRFWSDWTLPSPAEEPEMIEDYTCKSAYYNDLCAALAGRPKEPGWHHLLGYAQNQGGPMRARCELVSTGTAFSADLNSDDPQLKAARTRASDWVLLFQIEPEALTRLEAARPPPSAELFGDDRLYFWIRQADLKARRFDRVWLQRQ